MIDVLQITQGRQLTELLNAAVNIRQITSYLKTITHDSTGITFFDGNGLDVYAIRPISYMSCHLSLSDEEIILTGTNPTATVTIQKIGNGAVSAMYLKNPRYNIEPYGSPTFSFNDNRTQITFQYQLSDTAYTIYNTYMIIVADTEEYIGDTAYLRVVSKGK